MPAVMRTAASRSDHRQHGAAPRAERHPHADLVGPLRHAVGDHAVEAEQREQRRDGGEEH